MNTELANKITKYASTSGAAFFSMADQIESDVIEKISGMSPDLFADFCDSMTERLEIIEEEGDIIDGVMADVARIGVAKVLEAMTRRAQEQAAQSD